MNRLRRVSTVDFHNSLILLLYVMNRLSRPVVYVSTLDYLINVQDVVIMQAVNFPKIYKHAGCNKAMQVGIFQKSIVKNQFDWRISKN